MLRAVRRTFAALVLLPLLGTGLLAVGGLAARRQQG